MIRQIHNSREGKTWPLQEQLLQSQKRLKESNEQLEVRITERTEELQSLSDKFSHVARVTAMGELVGSIAHELNQPLTAILANAQAAYADQELTNRKIRGDLTCCYPLAFPFLTSWRSQRTR